MRSFASESERAKEHPAPRVQTKEFLPGFEGAHRITHGLSFPRERLALIIADKPQFSGLSMGLISTPVLNSERQAALQGQVGVHRHKARHAKECGKLSYVMDATHMHMHHHVLDVDDVSTLGTFRQNTALQACCGREKMQSLSANKGKMQTRAYRLRPLLGRICSVDMNIECE